MYSKTQCLDGPAAVTRANRNITINEEMSAFYNKRPVAVL